jgi:16S rRNA processing protein RimM
MTSARDNRVEVGRIAGAYGLQGWVRVTSYTSPPGNILRYGPWLLHDVDGGEHTYEMLDGRAHGEKVVAKLAGVLDRDAASRLIGQYICVARSTLGDVGDGRFFWCDLEGMEVQTPDGQKLGNVSHLFETGANDVMVVTGDRRRLIPFVRPQVIRHIDAIKRVIVADWDPSF